MRATTSPTSQRLDRETRRRQLMETAWAIVRDEGADALTLVSLARRAGITKPVVYDHFRTREGLFAELYAAYDARQTALMDAALEAAEASLEARAGAIADAFVNCVMTERREMPGIVAALSGTPLLLQLKLSYERSFLAKCQDWLSPFAGGATISHPALRAMLGAALALSGAAASGEIDSDSAKAELAAVIRGMVERAGVARTRAEPKGG